MNTVVLPIDTVIDGLMALSAVRGAMAERDHALVGHRLEAAIRTLIPLVVGRLSVLSDKNTHIECTDTEIIYTSIEAVSADTLCMVIISMARHMLNDNSDPGSPDTLADTTLPPSRTCYWY